MKKQLFISAIALLAGTAAHAAGNVYASQLSTDSSSIYLMLNQDATDVILELYSIDNPEYTVTHNFGPAQKGQVSFELTDVDAYDGKYTWKVTCKGEAYTTPTLLTADKPADLNITNARSIAIDNNQANATFGRMYVASPKNSKAGEHTQTGVYVLNADGTLLSNDAYTGGQAWSGNSGPNNVKVADNGQVFICDWTDAHSGVWVMDANDPSAAFTAVFAGARNATTGLITNNSVEITGSICDIALYGSGENRILYTTDEDVNTAVKCEVYLYNIGELEQPWTTAPSAVWGNDGGKIANSNQRIDSDRRGGLWLAQYRENESNLYPALLHANANGVWNYQTGDGSLFMGNSPNSSLGVNADGTLLAEAEYLEKRGSTITVTKVDFDENDVPTLTKLYTIDSSAYGSRPFGLGFDAANNLYCAFNNDNAAGGIGIWGLPVGENSFTTTANEPLVLARGLTGFDAISVEAAIEAPTEYFDMMGRRVAEPQAGKLYIKRCGANVSKVIF